MATRVIFTDSVVRGLDGSVKNVVTYAYEGYRVPGHAIWAYLGVHCLYFLVLLG